MNFRRPGRQPEQPKGAVLVIHENKGLNDWVRSVAGRFAGIGYSALAIDLLSSKGGTATFADPAQATAELTKIPPEESVANLKSGISELQRRAPGVKVAAVGFCMGGGMVRRLLASGEPQLAAAVPLPMPAARQSGLQWARRCCSTWLVRLQGHQGHLVEGCRRAGATKAGLVNETRSSSRDADHASFNDTGEALRPEGGRRRVAAGAGLVRQVPRRSGWFGARRTSRPWVFTISSTRRSRPVADRTRVTVLIRAMRVVQVANFYGPRSGGLRTAVDRLGAEYRTAGHEVYLVVPGAEAEQHRLPSGVVRISLPAKQIPFTGGYRAVFPGPVRALLSNSIRMPSKCPTGSRCGRWVRGDVDGPWRR